MCSWKKLFKLSCYAYALSIPKRGICGVTFYSYQNRVMLTNKDEVKSQFWLSAMSS